MRIPAIPLMLVPVLSFFCSCKKESNLINSSGIWKIGTEEYNIHFTGRQNINNYFILSGYENADTASSNSINVCFNETPVISKNYKMINFHPPEALLDNEIGIISTIGTLGIYTATGVKMNHPWVLADSANVVVSNGKIRAHHSFDDCMGAHHEWWHRQRINKWPYRRS